MQRFGRYEISSEIGKGGMGVVYRGVDTVLGRAVAIKTIRLSEQGTPEEAATLRERLMREARAAAALSHPNVVAIHDVGQEGDVAWIVMELVQGRTLEDLLADPEVPRSEEFLLRVLEDTARALDYAHAHGVVHRDVKPGNILVQDSGVAKIVDFGIAKVTWSRTMTETGMLMGSPHYMAPEQLKGERVTGRTDQFSLGAIAYTALAGRKPFDGDTFATLASKILFEPAPSPRLFNARVSPEVEQVLGKAMSKDPAGRFDNCAQFVEALRSAFHRAEPKPVQDAGKAAPRRKRLALAALAAAMVIVAVLVGYWLTRRQPDRRVVSQAAVEPEAVRKPVVANQPGPAAQPPKPVPKPKDQEPAPPPRALEQRVNAADGLVYLKVPLGTFQMGCSPGDKECSDDEKPAHPVTLTKAFWIGQTEVTGEAYRRFTQAVGGQMPPAPSYNQDWEAKYPMGNVTWEEAGAFCKWAGGRLPTEAEWEYAARAGSQKAFYANLDAIAWYGRKDGDKTHPAAQKAPNAFGLYDMLGNVREWCQDSHAPYAAGALTDPTATTSGYDKVMRGAAFDDRPRALRTSGIRFTAGRQSRNHDFGFRCVLPAP
jgi:eukaryotic-like serine/threonine-protein kinase